MKKIRAAAWLSGVIALALLLPQVSTAQDKAALRPVRVVMASTKLQVLAGKPMHFSLLSVTLPAGKTASYAGADGFVFVANGKLELVAGADKFNLAEGEAKYIPAGITATLRATGPKTATLLHYLLAPGDKAYSGAASVVELYRSKEPAPVVAGPHEFSLTRVTSPVGAPQPPMHHRSGAALYRVLSGTGTIHMPGKDEPRSTGAVQYEPNGFIHTWENSGKAPLVLLQANISAEGAPEIIWLK
jgi:mannose-6-phosphate isomerase-like protein (cupin superfamily)